MIEGIGKHGGLAIVLDSPTAFDLARHTHIYGEQADLLETLLTFAGFKPNDCYVTFAIKDRVEGKVTADMIKQNHQALIDELSAVKPTKILAMGGTALSLLRNAEKPLSIQKERGLGEWVQLNDYACFTVSTFPIWWVFKDSEVFRDVVKDFKKLSSRDEPMQEPEIDWFMPETVKEVEEGLKYFATLDVVSIDIESTGFNPLTDTMTAIGFGFVEKKDLSKQRQGGQAFTIPEQLIYNKRVKKMVADFFLKNHKGKKVFHNAIFDLQFLEYYIGESLLDVDIDDTILMSYLTDERSIGGESGKGISPHGLKTLSRVYFDQKDYHFDFPNWIKKPKEERDYYSLYKYLCYDLIYTAQLYYILKDEIDEEDKDLWNVYDTLLIPGTKTFAQIQLQGAPIDRKHLEKMDEDLTKKIEITREKILALIQEMGCPQDFIAEFNPNSSQQIGKVLYEYMGVPKIKKKNKKTKTAASVDKSTLEEFNKLYAGTVVEEFINLIIDLRTYTKILSTYVHGLLDSSQYDGNAHGSFKVIGTTTGRLSSANPNMQNIPSRVKGFKKEIKKAFVAPEGYTFISVDLSQAEYRVVAALSDDEKMLQLFNDGVDLHSYVGSLVLNKPIEEVADDERDISKQLGFSVLYGAANKSLSERLIPKLGSEWTEKKVEETLKWFLRQFDKLGEWIEAQKEFARKNHYIKHSIGRYRRFPFIHSRIVGEVGRQAVNTPPQSLASDLVTYAAINLHRELKPYDAQIVTVVHDNINVIVPDEHLKDVLALIMYEMTENLLIPLKIKMKADAALGHSWGECSKVNVEEFLNERAVSS